MAIERERERESEVHCENDTVVPLGLNPKKKGSSPVVVLSDGNLRGVDDRMMRDRDSVFVIRVWWSSTVVV